MADLIDRQAALEELAVYIHLIDKTMGKGTLTDDDCMEAAKSVLGEDELPAVQPEIIHCKDCKHHFVHRCMDSIPTEICDLNQTFYDAEVDFCSLAERRTG